ncbi:MAG: hypothetical protein LBF89_04595 [Bacteroidales bacterium]|jgi:hypothetical protein|nr:hypothetical protein [Bacteroidales bacterium]
MIIANPLYDTVFKRLMEDEQVARFVVGTLLDIPVVTIEVKSQEVTYMEDEQSKLQAVALRLYRLDFVATIRTGENEYTKVLIEVQKALKVANLRRFRKYIAEQYRRDDIIENKKDTLPIIAIYILGFELPEISTACVRVNKNYYDAVHKMFIDIKSHFIERVMHDCVVVQARRIEKDLYATHLDKLLSVFEQEYFFEEEMTKDYRHLIDDENIRRMTDILHYCASDIDERKRIEAEHEAWETYQELLESTEKDNLQKIERQMKEIAEKEAALAEKDAILAEKDAVLAEKDTALARERAEKEVLLAELARLKR